MKWFRIATDMLDNPDFSAAYIEQRGVWISLLAFCAGKENSGTIANCKAWNDRQWMQACGIMKDDLESDCALWSWDGEDLVVSHYPIKDQAKNEALRVRGAEAGKRSAAKRKVNQQADQKANQMVQPNGTPDANQMVNQTATNGSTDKDIDKDKEEEVVVVKRKKESLEPSASAAAFDPFSGDTTPAPPDYHAQVSRNVTDLVAMYPKLALYGQETDMVQAMIRAHGYNECEGALQYLTEQVTLGALKDKNGHPRQRIYFSDLQNAIANAIEHERNQKEQNQ